jgi:hypothetical protein
MKRFTLGLLILLFTFCAQAAPTVNIIPNQANYQVGDTILLSVSLSESPPIHGGGLNIAFNPNVIQAQSVVIDSTWSFASRPGIINNAAGSIGDILFASFNTVEGELGVAIIQLAVVGDGDSALSVTKSAKNPFSDADGQVVAFDINNLFAFSTQVAETPTEEAPVAETTQATTTQTTASQTTTDPVTQTTEQTTTQTTSTEVTTTNNNTSNQTFSTNIASVNLPNKTVGDKQGADSGQAERKIFLPSGPGAIPIKVIDDAEMQQKIARNSNMNNTSDRNNQQQAVIKEVNESLLASAEAMSEGQSSQTNSNMQPADVNESLDIDSPVDYLSFVLILAILFVGFIVFKVFFNK